MAGSITTRRVHGTALALDGHAALLLGPSGAGKSDLALRAIHGTFRAGDRLMRPVLVADDQALIEPCDGGLIVRAPAAIQGRIEVRGLGIVAVPAVAEARLTLAVELVPAERIERLPDPVPSYELLGIRLPLLRLAPFEASAPLKLVLALAQAAPSRPGES